MNTVKSTAVETTRYELPLYTGHVSMVKFCLETLNGLPVELNSIVKNMLNGIKAKGYGYFTIHGETLKKGETLRRPGAHIDGNFEPCSWSNGGGNGWKVGENGPAIDTDFHKDTYINENGGIILVSNFESCVGWIGDYTGVIGVGGDCSKMNLDDNNFMLKRDTVYYGNNHFIHESLPVSDNTHRVFARITLPMTHTYAN